MKVSLGMASAMEIHAGGGGAFISETTLPDTSVILVMKGPRKGVLYGKQRCFQPDLILF